MPVAQKQPWRYRCTEGHTSWYHRGDYYYCEHCDDTFNRLIDWKTKEPTT